MKIYKQIILSVGLMMMAAGSAEASPLTPEAALARVANGKNTNMRLKMAARKPRLVHTQMAGGAPALYVFNQTDNDGGFMILSADDVAPALLAYSDNGGIDIDNLPPALIEWMTSLSEDISAVAASRRKPRTSPNTTGGWADIEPFVTTHWAQGSPYKIYCPVIGSDTCVVGCAATAMAQVMNYYQWPKHGQGVMSYKLSSYGQITVDFVNGNIPDYDWDNMADWYDHNNVRYDAERGKWIGTVITNTQKEKEAVALLSYHAGVAVKMNYGASSSSAVSYRYIDTGSMVENFCYDKRIRYVERDEEFKGKDDDWEAMIYNELVHRRPIYYTGHSANAGHAFVCDGYKKEVGTDGNTRNYFHINWGWQGISDGYYIVTAFYADDDTPLFPAFQSIGGSGEHFANTQAVIMNIRPNNTKYLYSNDAPVIYDGTEVLTDVVPGKEYKFQVNMYNGCVEKATYYYGVEFYNVETQKSDFFSLKDANVLDVNTKYTDFMFTWPTDVIPATYKVYPCYRTSEDGEFTRLEIPYNNDVPTVEYIGDEYVLNDGNAYAQPCNSVYKSVTYTRKFVPGVWNSWYLPFEINTDELAENHLSAACMNAVRQYDDDGDGIFERIEFEILKIKRGVLYAATPYFIKADDEYHDYNKVTLGRKTLTKSSTMNSVHTETAYAEYDFCGTYSRIDDGWKLGYHIMVADGGLRQTTSYVPAVDWYMYITPKKPMYGEYTPASTGSSTITLTVVGEEDATTGIKTFYDAKSPKRTSQVMYNIRGEQVNDNYNGIVIVNGHKILKKNY